MSVSPPKFLVDNLAVVVVARNHNPTVLNPDFLKHNHIVPEDWELSGAPICVEPVAKVSFAQGVNIVAQPDRVSFSEGLTGKQEANLAVPKIAAKYVETLKHVNYRALGINPSGHVVVDGGADAAREFIAKKFFAPQILDCTQASPVRGGVRISFPFDGWTLNLSVEEGLAQPPGEAPVPVVIFEGNYHLDLQGKSVEERIKSLQDGLNDLPKILGHYKELVTRIVAV